jgi:hypothetical protein
LGAPFSGGPFGLAVFLLYFLLYIFYEYLTPKEKKATEKAFSHDTVGYIDPFVLGSGISIIED